VIALPLILLDCARLFRGYLADIENAYRIAGIPGRGRFSDRGPAGRALASPLLRCCRSSSAEQFCVALIFWLPPTSSQSQSRAGLCNRTGIQYGQIARPSPSVTPTLLLAL